jgi:hypothetical protein
MFAAILQLFLCRAISQMYSNAALSLSDMDATYLDLEQAALEHSLESFSQSEHANKKRASTNIILPTTNAGLFSNVSVTLSF